MATFVLLFLAIKTVNGGVICGQANECANQVISTDILQAYGYQSNIGQSGSIAVSRSAFCYGSYSCTNTTNITAGNAFCYGSNSCTNTKIYPTFSKSIFCYGLNACKNSFMKADTSSIDLFCYGHNSCANAIITNVEHIYGYGAYALTNSIIISNKTATTTITLDGYHAGDNLKIICESTAICNINCRAAACDLTIFDCGGNNNCNIQTYSDFYLHSYVFQFIAANNNIIDVNNIDNDLCNNFASTTVDKQYSDYDPTVINQLSSYTNICCRASGTCSEITTAISANNIVCSGAQSTCSKIEIDEIFDSIYCTGASSCNSMVINANKNVYCMGNYACISVNITNAENIYLTGSASADNMIINGVTNLYRLNFNQLTQTIVSNGNLNAYFLNDLVSNSDIQIYCNKNDNCMIKCATTRSCIDTRIYCYGNCVIYCKLVTDHDNPEYVCPNATVINTGTVNYELIYTDTPTLSPTNMPSYIPTTNNPTTDNPTTNRPSTSIPSTNIPSTNTPSTYMPSSNRSTTNIPTANTPTTSNVTNSTTTGREEETANQHGLSHWSFLLITLVVLIVIGFVVLYCFKKRTKNAVKSKNDVNETNYLQLSDGSEDTAL